MYGVSLSTVQIIKSTGVCLRYFRSKHGRALATLRMRRTLTLFLLVSIYPEKLQIYFITCCFLLIFIEQDLAFLSMKHYKFSTREFGISDTGIHLLRSNFNYNTINFKDITSLEIGRGRLIRNWFFVFIFGISLIAFSIYYAFVLIEVLNDPTIRKIYIEELLVPVLPALLGGFCIYSSSRKGIIIKIEHNGKKSSYPLEDIIKNNLYTEFVDYLAFNVKVYSKMKLINNHKELASIE